MTSRNYFWPFVIAAFLAISFWFGHSDRSAVSCGAGYHNAVIFQQYRAAIAERSRHPGTHRVRTDQINSVGVGPERLKKQRARLAIAFEPSAGCRERD